MSHLRSITTETPSPIDELIHQIQHYTENDSLPLTLKKTSGLVIAALERKHFNRIFVSLKIFVDQIAADDQAVSLLPDALTHAIVTFLKNCYTYFTQSEDIKERTYLLNVLRTLSNCLQSMQSGPSQKLFAKHDSIKKMAQVAERLFQINQDTANILHNYKNKPSLNYLTPDIDEELLRDSDAVIKSLKELEKELDFAPDAKYLINLRLEWMRTIVRKRSLLLNHYHMNTVTSDDPIKQKLREKINTGVDNCEKLLESTKAESYAPAQIASLFLTYSFLAGGKHSATKHLKGTHKKVDQYFAEVHRFLALVGNNFDSDDVAYAINIITPVMLRTKQYDQAQDMMWNIYHFLDEWKISTDAAIGNQQRELVNEYNNIIREDVRQLLNDNEANLDEENRCVFNHIVECFESTWDKEGNLIETKRNLLTQAIQKIEEKEAPKRKATPQPTKPTLAMLDFFRREATSQKRIDKVRGLEEYLLTIGSEQDDTFIVNMNQVGFKIANAPAEHTLTSMNVKQLLFQTGHPQAILHAHLKNIYTPKIERELLGGEEKRASTPTYDTVAIKPRAETPPAAIITESKIAESKVPTAKKLQEERIKKAAARSAAEREAKLKKRPVESNAPTLTCSGTAPSTTSTANVLSQEAATPPSHRDSAVTADISASTSDVASTQSSGAEVEIKSEKSLPMMAESSVAATTAVSAVNVVCEQPSMPTQSTVEIAVVAASTAAAPVINFNVQAAAPITPALALEIQMQEMLLAATRAPLVIDDSNAANTTQTLRLKSRLGLFDKPVKRSELTSMPSRHMFYLFETTASTCQSTLLEDSVKTTAAFIQRKQPK